MPDSAEISRTDRVRVLVVGAGLIGGQRAAAIRTSAGAVLAATVDPRPDSSSPDVPHYARLEDVPAETYDAAVIAVPHDLAGDLAAVVLRTGRPVLIEKPLGVTAAAARELEALADRVSAPSFVGFNYRYLPGIRRLRDALSSGRLGELRNLDMLVGHGGQPHSAEGWKLDPARAGGGVLLDPGVHLLDLLLDLAPGARCTGIEATGGFWGTGIEEDVVATFRDGELLATIRVSHIRWVNTFRVEAFGDDGYAIVEGRGGNYGPMTLRLGRRWAWIDEDVASQRESEETHDFGSENESLRDELEAVIAAWRSGAPQTGDPHPATPAEARAVTSLCEELYLRGGFAVPGHEVGTS
jgi:1,5-anhydro-D-fructose reductase (1,5-anhydro-D-mannitol-forming)